MLTYVTTNLTILHDITIMSPDFDSGPSSQVGTFSAQLNEIFNDFDANVNTELLKSFVHAKGDNAIKQHLASHLIDKVRAYNYDRTCLRSIRIPYSLPPDKQSLLSDMYPGLQLRFQNCARHAHAFAASSRILEYSVLLNDKIGYDKKNEEQLSKVVKAFGWDMLVKDVGGNPMLIVSQDNNLTHVCSPVIKSNAYDSVRRTTRLMNLVLNSATHCNNAERDNNVFKSLNNSISSKNCCSTLSQYCKVKAPFLMFVHSIYDMSLEDIADSMDSAEAMIGYGTFIYTDEILICQNGKIKDLNCWWRYTKPITNRQWSPEETLYHTDGHIEFGFNDDDGFNYRHSLANYKRFLTQSRFCSSSGNYFAFELLENRCGIQYFKVTRELDSNVEDGVLHTINIRSLNDKLLCSYFEMQPYTNRTVVRQTKCDYTDTDSWTIPECHKIRPVRFAVEKKIVEHTKAYLIGVKDKLKPGEVVSYLRTYDSRIVCNGSVVQSKLDMNADERATLAHALYLVTYDDNYRRGKVLQQAISDIEVNRSRFLTNFWNTDMIQDHLNLNRNSLLTERLSDYFYFNRRSAITYSLTAMTAGGVYLMSKFQPISKYWYFASAFVYGVCKYFVPRARPSYIDVSSFIRTPVTKYQFRTLKVKSKNSYNLISVPINLNENEVDRFVKNVMQTIYHANDDAVAAVSNMVDNTMKSRKLNEIKELPNFDRDDEINFSKSKRLSTTYEDASDDNVSKADTVEAVTDFESVSEVDDFNGYRPRSPPPVKKFIKANTLGDGHCCFRAATINRLQDRESVRLFKESMREYGDESMKDFLHEISGDNWGGSAFLEVYADVIKCQFLVYDKDENLLFSTANKYHTQRHLCYDQHHYDLLVPYHDGTPTSVYHALPSAFDYDKVFPIINNVIGMEKYYTGNMKFVCDLHTECLNNGLERAYLDTSKTYFIAFIEKQNVNVEELNRFIRKYKCLVKLHAIYSDNHYVVSVDKQSRVTPKEFDAEFDKLDKHFELCSCKNHQYKSSKTFEGSVVYYCRTRTVEWVNKKPEEVDLVVHFVVGKRQNKWIFGTNPIYFGFDVDGDSMLHDNTDISHFVEYMKRNDFGRYSNIFVVNEIKNAEKLIKVIDKLLPHLTKKNIIHNVNVSHRYAPYFVQNNDQNDLIHNSMSERRFLWEHSVKNTTESLQRHFDAAVECANNDSAINCNDLSFHLMRVKDRKILCGTGIMSINDVRWGWDGSSMIHFDSLDPKVIQTKTDSPYIAFNKNSVLLQSYFHHQLVRNIDIKDYDCKTNFVNVVGAPGTGKTQFILNNNKSVSDVLIITVSREAKNEMVDRAKSMSAKGEFDINGVVICTFDSFMINYEKKHKTKQYKEVWFDEARLAHGGDWLWVTYLTKCEKMYIVGDQSQIPYVERTSYIPQHSIPKLNFVETKTLEVSYRCPKDVVHWLNVEKAKDGSSFYNFTVKSKNPTKNSMSRMIITGVQDVPKYDDAQYLTFTVGERDLLIGHGQSNVMTLKEFTKSLTVHQFQGNQNKTVVLVRLNSKDAFSIYKDKQYSLVAYTRHTKSFLYCTVNPQNDQNWEMVGRIMNFTDNEMSYLGGYKHITTEYEKTQLSFTFPKIVRSLNDYFSYGDYICKRYNVENIIEKLPEQPHVESDDVKYPIEIIQDFHDILFPNPFEGVDKDHDLYNDSDKDFNADFRFCSLPIYDQRKDFAKPELKTAIRGKVPNVYTQTIKAFCERNGGVPLLQGDVDQKRMANILVDTVLKICDKNLLAEFAANPITMNNLSTMKWINKQPETVRKMIMNDPIEFYDKNLRDYNMALKGNAKPDLDPFPESRYKSSQTIAYQDKLVNAVFCPVMADFTDRLMAAINNNVVLFNRMSNDEFVDIVNDVCPPNRFKSFAGFYEIDFSKFDKSQDLVALEFEVELMRVFGFPEHLLALWFEMHKSTRLIDHRNRFSADVEYQRKSGDAGTWVLNTLFQMAVVISTMDITDKILDDRVFCTFSGDDSLVFVDKTLNNIQEVSNGCAVMYNLEVKLLHYNTPYFCSKFFIPTEQGLLFVPDVVKTVVKLGRKDLVNVDHAREYHISFADNNKSLLNVLNWSYISQCINDRYHISGDHHLVFKAICTLIRDKDMFLNLWDYSNTKSYTILPKLEI